ncbi:ABC transporter ATP-binding protein [Tumidithrix elongata RA019]|uniref:ABC transporter ATP-binding protein n=1 Tax=Tumidithrix elongata BACA0141 TaxID=2716417 RepID=A0AAW9Q2F8_9CYAN|nr:ABC transporter ATP-binding protein [Tumidithrix elongata RA019]
MEKLSKKYMIGHQMQQRNSTLRDLLSNTAKSITQRIFNPYQKVEAPSYEEFWALRDVSFEIKQGEVVGIIGRNGAGKSTLLKILSRITEPTSGRIAIKGRVASLLEVGTGFHPELTGRENIFLNGAILGMSKVEISKKFDEIVDFSGVEKFLDTPVKHFSSGMYTRLAFAVAAQLEPEILIVDEVLAVGDGEFQKKCLGKIENLSSEGRTVIFVSHNMGTINFLCDRCILMNQGNLVLDGAAGSVIQQYLTSATSYSAGQQVWSDLNKSPGDEFVRVRAIRIVDKENKVCTTFDVRDPVFVEIEFYVLKEVRVFVEFFFRNEIGQITFASKDNLDSPWKDVEYPLGLYRSVCEIPMDFLNDGTISVSYGIITGHHNIHARGDDILCFSVTDRLDPEGVRGNFQYEWIDAGVRPRLNWQVDKID